MSEKKDKDKCSGCNGESCCSSCSDDTNVGNTCRTNHDICPIYSVRLGSTSNKLKENYDTVVEDVDKALKMAAEKYFKWHVIFGELTNIQIFDTIEEAEEYVNSIDIATAPLFIIFGQQQKIVPKYAIEPKKI